MEGERSGIKLVAGNSNPVLTREVCDYLGIEPAVIEVGKFSDGETKVKIGLDENVRGREVYVLQSTCPPVNDNLMELLIIMDALKRASAKRIIAVIPYYGYGRQEKKVEPHVPITARLVADLLDVAGASKLISMDFHAGPIQGFFNFSADNIFVKPVLLAYIQSHFSGELVLVSPDVGRVNMVRSFAKKLEAKLVIIDKRRPEPNASEVMNVIGEEDVRGRTAIILDDMIDTAGTITQAALAIMERGATGVYACCTHPVLSGPAIERIDNSPLEKVVVTNTIPLNAEAAACRKITQLSVGALLGETIKRDFNQDSVSSLFV
jgi:ribose-phosphate pyrophosphokinase